MAIAYLVACVPPIALLVYIWYLDRLEHEPWKLVAGVFVASALLGTFAASLLETIGGALLGNTLLGGIPVLGDLVYYFCVVALVEELCKFAPVRALAWRNPEFDHRFDAVVYCVASAIGFAVFENIMYVGAFGADVAIGRLIPVHTICGIFMGYYLACAKICERGRNMEQRKRYLWQSILVPVVIHGAWDFCVSMEVDALAMLALLGITALTIYAFVLMKRLAKFDAPL